MKETEKTDIFKEGIDVEQRALEIFRFQYTHNNIYRRYVDGLGVKAAAVTSLSSIPFLPIRFFKSHQVVTGSFLPQVVFESSGTTGTSNSRHYVKDVQLYVDSFLKSFLYFYGDVRDYCVIGLLPSYLERQGSSLVYMVNRLMSESARPESNFYLYDFEKLASVLKQLEAAGTKTILIGVTYALLDFAEKYPMPLRHTLIMETGGMKGRREELVRQEVHRRLKDAFGLKSVHSEYGMTELLSQAYSKGEGIFRTPPWMKIFMRDEEDPLSLKQGFIKGKARGVMNVMDLANIYSCSFVATDDLGVLYEDGSFEVQGRMDTSDLRGCSLMWL